MPPEEWIDNEEWLYRSFPVPDTRQNGAIHYEIIDGVLRLGRGAWNDRNLRPSVDRKLLLSSPSEVVERETDAVVQIQAKEIRSISGTIQSSGNESHTHDVIFDKTPVRPAHALITTSPAFADRPNSEKTKWKTFQRLLSLAAEKHGWVIEPEIS
ncbi:MAG: hypothetical protein ACK5XX_04170 [Holosporales bacterium]|jgi:hypothetical protein|nr:hypothetical protein [Thalassospira sp.]